MVPPDVISRRAHVGRMREGLDLTRFFEEEAPQVVRYVEGL